MNAENKNKLQNHLYRSILNKKITKHTRWKVDKFFLWLHCPIKFMKSHKRDNVDNNIAACNYLKAQLLTVKSVHLSMT